MRGVDLAFRARFRAGTGKDIDPGTPIRVLRRGQPECTKCIPGFAGSARFERPAPSGDSGTNGSWSCYEHDSRCIPPWVFCRIFHRLSPLSRSFDPFQGPVFPHHGRGPGMQDCRGRCFFTKEIFYLIMHRKARPFRRSRVAESSNLPSEEGSH